MTRDKSTYTLKFYRGLDLIAEHTWDANESYLDDITHDAENLIEEAIDCNPPPSPGRIIQANSRGRHD